MSFDLLSFIYGYFDKKYFLFNLAHRYEKLQNGVKHFDNDGLNSLKYKVLEIKKTPLYIWIHVDINQDTVSYRSSKSNTTKQSV